MPPVTITHIQTGPRLQQLHDATYGWVRLRRVTVGMGFGVNTVGGTYAATHSIQTYWDAFTSSHTLDIMLHMKHPHLGFDFVC